MYSTCLFCHHHLGTNEAIEPFPVGRRLAYDATKGRLWVVCTKCARWNLTPLEERWDAIDECERRFSATHVRVSTDEIGLAHLREGLELVRIGRPLRPEFAAWRYGEQLKRRRRRATVVGSVGGMGMAATAIALPVVAPAMALVAGIGALGTYLGAQFFTPPWALMYGDMKDDLIAERIVTHVPLGEGHKVTVRLKHMRDAEFETRGDDDLPALRVFHDHGDHAFEGTAALRSASLLLTHANWRGASAREIGAAVDRIDRSGDALHLLTTTARIAQRFRGRRLMAGWRDLDTLNVSYVDRLAIEMAVHEESERRAMDGELRALAIAWRDAEEIAAIADDMFLPSELGDGTPHRKPSVPGRDDGGHSAGV
jgi:hypothetical protein